MPGWAPLPNDPKGNRQPMTTDADAVRAIAELAYTAQEQPDPIELVHTHLLGFVLQPGQTVHTIDISKHADWPRRKAGTVTHADVDSFADYINRHKDKDATTLWADADPGTVTAVLNDHEKGTDEAHTNPLPGWGDHRATLTVQHTPDWQAWIRGNGQLVDQATFAEFLEDLAHTIIQPDSATMIELAQHFQAARNVDFESARRSDSGETQLTYQETITASAGRGTKRGTIEIPDAIVVKVAPFVGSDEVELTARFRYRLVETAVKLGYRLVRPDMARDEAFDKLLARLTTATSLDVMHGAPRPLTSR